MRTVRNIEVADAGPPAGAAGCGDVRCGCGSLLARVVGGEIELKCRRCKQVWRLALDPAGAEVAPRLLPEGAR